MYAAPGYGQDATLNASTPPPAIPAQIAETIEGRLDQVWRYTADDAGGFSDIDDFAEPPSLEQTAWFLDIAAIYDIEVERLDRERALAWVLSVIEQPNLEPTLDELVRLDLATRVLGRLDADQPTASVVDRLERMRAGWGYAFRPGGTPSWTATLHAARILRAVGGPLPQPVADEVRRQLPIVTAVQVPEIGSQWDLPLVWYTATGFLPEEILAPMRPVLRERLQTRIDDLRGRGCPDSFFL
jgi:hypothetical protein